jgi:hypothetical protein
MATGFSGEGEPLTSFDVGQGFRRLSWEGLARIRLVARRRGVWFKALSGIDRVLLDLSLKVTRTIKSPVLMEALMTIVGKLHDALESGVERQMRSIGIPLAQKISMIALKWGTEAAREWTRDTGFIRYLTIMKING